jgi:hypothetical protein
MIIVCDGHGKHGEKVAEFVTSKLKSLISNWFEMNKHQILEMDIRVLD